ncbi:hypothetical protein HDV06_006930 [Boothiomyces sp. JEL0866]|nr:hypothetical protein HDV06_006930 [Boothiomyces sp. JEL0866]
MLTIYHITVEWIHLNTAIPKPLITPILLFVGFLLWYFYRVEKTQLFHSTKTADIRYKSPITKEVKSLQLHQMIKLTCPSLQTYFFPHPLLINGHLQTFHASIFADYVFEPKVKFHRQVVNTPDGGVISLDWTDLPKENSKRTPYLFILHGLTGGSHETYVQDLVIEAKKYGYASIVMNFRGCSETPVKSAQLYSGSFTGDVELSIQEIKRRDPSAVLFGVGFSLGSNVIVKYAGKMGANCPLIGVVSIGNPYDFLGSLRALHRSWLGRYLYSIKMGQNLARLLNKHHHAFKDCEWLDMNQVNKATTIVEFDAAATSKGFGYKTVHEYYRFGSCAIDIPYITVPTLLLTALDDPISNCEVIPYYEIESNPNVVLATTGAGGHLGWFKISPELVPTQRWFAKPVAEFIHSIFEAKFSLDEQSKIPQDLLPVGTPWHSLPEHAIEAQQILLGIKRNSIHIEKHQDIPVQDTVVQTTGATEEPEKTHVAVQAVIEKKSTSSQIAKTRNNTFLYMMRLLNINSTTVMFFLLGFLFKKYLK